MGGPSEGVSRRRPALIALLAVAVLAALLSTLVLLGSPGEDGEQLPVAAPEPQSGRAAVEPGPGPSPEPEPEPPAPITFRPVTMEIPTLGVSAPMDPQVPDSENVLGVPANPKRLGWREAGALPGAEVGTLLTYGHVVNQGYGRGSLYDLKGLEVGDDIVLRGGQGERVTYRVVDNAIVHKDDMPATEMLALDGRHRLAVYTCSGSPDATGHRQYRVVVWAEQVTPVKGA